MKHVTIFDTKFCIPKGYDVKKGYVVCKIPIEELRKKESREEIRKDIDKLWDNFHNQNFTKEEFGEWIKNG